MSITFNGTTQYLTSAKSVVGNTPSSFSFVAWVKGSPQDNRIFLCFSRSSNINPCFLIGSGSTGVSQSNSAIRFFIRNDSGTIIWGNSPPDAGGVVFDSTWHHVVAKWDGNIASLLVDGVVVKTSGSLSLGTITLDTTEIGARPGLGLFYSGSIAEVGIWNVAINNDEAFSLSRGVSPIKIRTSSLLFYSALVRNINDYKNGLSITNTAGAVISEHPRIYN